jgi:hypothetical protein
MLAVKKLITEGIRLPTGYGFSYFDMGAQVAVCYPIPINVLVRAWRWLIIKTRIPGFALDIDTLVNDAYRTGWKRGFIRGRQDRTQEIQNELVRLQGLRGKGQEDHEPGRTDSDPQEPARP